MNVQLQSIEHAPSSLPYWHTLMDDLCNPRAERVARVLGISSRTVYRYNATGNAPKLACLAVFWLTSWGRATVHTQAHNDARMMAGLANSLRAERDRLDAEVRHLKDQIEQSEQARISAPESQIETEWKVLLGPSANPAAAEVPAEPPAPTVRRYVLGSEVRSGKQPEPLIEPQAARSIASVCAGTQAGSLAFGSMLGALAGGTQDRSGRRERDALDVPTSAHAGNAQNGPPSLPLADQRHHRAGTPPSATALRALKPASGLDSLKQQPWRRASANDE